MRPVFKTIVVTVCCVAILSVAILAYVLYRAETREPARSGLGCAHSFPRLICDAIVDAPPGSSVQTVQALDDLLHWMINMRVRRKYCARHGVDISRYRRAFGRSNAKMAKEAYRTLEIVGLSQTSVWPEFEEQAMKLVEKDMEKRGRRLGGIDGKAACELLQQKPRHMSVQLNIERHTPLGHLGHLPIFR
ncbi:MAG: hypothetical protein ACR2O4_01085 [Hyphomicrobiaceae bacterium]